MKGGDSVARAVSLVPGRSLLIGISQPQHKILTPVWSRNLQTDRQSALGKAARNRNRRQSPDVDGTGISQQLKLRRTKGLGISSEFRNRRSRNGSGGRDQHV